MDAAAPARALPQQLHGAAPARAIKQRSYPTRGLGNFGSASGFVSTFDGLNDYLMMRRRGGRRPSLSDQRRLFAEHWRALIAELAAA